MTFIRYISFGFLVLIQALTLYVVDDTHTKVAKLSHKLAYAEQEIYALNVDLAETIEEVVRLTDQGGHQ